MRGKNVGGLALLAAVIASGAAPAGAGAAAESLGYRIESITPHGPEFSVAVISVTAPAGAGFGSFSIGTPRPTRITVPTGSVAAAEPGVTDESVSPRNVRLDGPGTLRFPPRAVDLALRSTGCVRDGYASSGRTPDWLLALPPGQTARIYVDLYLARGFAGRTPTLTLTPGAWVREQPDAKDGYLWSEPPLFKAGGASVTALVPRSAQLSHDRVSLKTKQLRDGSYRLTGSISPARAGQRVAVVGMPVTGRAADPKGGAFDDVLSAIAPVQAPKRVLARATTDALGRFKTHARLRAGTQFVARTTSGVPGTSGAGASCPLTLEP